MADIIAQAELVVRGVVNESKETPVEYIGRWKRKIESFLQHPGFPGTERILIEAGLCEVQRLCERVPHPDYRSASVLVRKLEEWADQALAHELLSLEAELKMDDEWQEYQHALRSIYARAGKVRLMTNRDLAIQFGRVLIYLGLMTDDIRAMFSEEEWWYVMAAKVKMTDVTSIVFSTVRHLNYLKKVRAPGWSGNGAPPEEQARKNRKRARDRAIRAAMKGES